MNVKKIKGLDNNFLKVNEKIRPVVPDTFFGLHTLIAFVGSTGTGKTQAAIRLAMHYLDEKAFTIVYTISPTCDQNAAFELLKQPKENFYSGRQTLDNPSGCLQNVLDRIEQLVKEYFQRLEYIRVYERWKKGLPLTYAEDYLLKKNFYEPKPELPRPSPLLIIDDLSHTSMYRGAASNLLINTLLRHRHLFEVGFSIFLLVQTWKSGLPKSVRQNCRQFCIFITHDGTQLHSIYEEVAAQVSEEEFLEAYDLATKEKHHFLTIDMIRENGMPLFRINFDHLLNFTPQPKQIKKTTSKNKKRKRNDEPTGTQPDVSVLRTDTERRKPKEVLKLTG
jgi:hypothetical protein